MKKKLFMMVMTACIVLSMTACTGNKETDQTTEISTEAESGEAEVKKEKKETESTRIVSVDKVEEHVTIAQYKGIELEKMSSEVTDEMVEERIAEILENASKETMGSKSKIQEGDLITVSYLGTIDGKTFDGGKVYSYDWTVGSGEMFPAFEEGVLGMKRGETKKILCTFPDDYHGEALAGKEVVFTVTVQTIRRTPKLDDVWVKENSKSATVDEYKAAVRSELEASREADIENALKSVAWEKIVTNSTMIEYPEKDIETAKSLYNAQMMAYAESYQMSLEEFVASQGMTMDAYKEQCQLYAERKVKQNLIVQGIIDEEKIQLDDEESLEIQNKIMVEYGAANIAELVDMYSQIQIDESIALLRVEDFIYENAVLVEPLMTAAKNEGVASEEVTEEKQADEHASESASEE